VKQCLDSWAALAWLDGDEPAAAEVARALDGVRPVMSWVNLIEVHYRVSRDHGEAEADRTLAEIRSEVAEELPGVSTMRAVARLKAKHPIALADCFAISAAEANKAQLLTGDPEIIDRADELPCAVIDLRS
jgi:predicted nucleic acid-binding protein